MMCALLVNSCICAATTARENRPKPHEDISLSEKEHEVDGEHSSEYDHEAFLGDVKDEYDDLPQEEAIRRLKVLVKKVDADKDGFVTEEELTKWVRDVFSKRLLEGVDEDLKSKDTDGNGKLTWDEYTKATYGPEEMEDDADEETKKLLNTDKRRFDTADKDKDGALTKEEFVHFMHPESSSEMGDIHVLETIEDIDRDKDGFVSMKEFLGDFEDPDDKEADEPEWVKEETKRFNEEYDKNHDGKLDKDEVRQWILPETDHMMALEESKHLIQSADENKDGKLSEEEIAQHHDVFVGSEATDYGRALPKHEEL